LIAIALFFQSAALDRPLSLLLGMRFKAVLEPEAAEGNKILPVDVVAIKSISRSEKLSKKILANLEIEISL